MAGRGCRSRWSSTAVGMVAIGAALAACASGGSDAGPTTTAAEATTPRATSTTVGATSPSSTATPADPASVPADPSSGCRSGSIHITNGNEKVTTTSGGMDRWYFVNVPASNTKATPQPLVLDLHGYLEGAQLHAGVSGLNALGQFEGFVTVTPQGQGDPVHWETTLDSTDIAYVDEVLDHVEETTCIDRNREYATGFSNGAFLTSTLACVDSERFAAVAPVAGIRDVPGCKPKRPVPVITFHGTEDEFVVYEGGIGSGAEKLPAVDSKTSGKTMGDADPKTAADILPGDIDDTVPEILAAWSERNGCTGKEVASKVSSDTDLLRESCPAGAEAELYRVTGGGHAWPGSVVGATLDSVTGHTTGSIDATKLIWAFFEAHPLRKG